MIELTEAENVALSGLIELDGWTDLDHSRHDDVKAVCRRVLAEHNSPDEPKLEKPMSDELKHWCEVKRIIIGSIVMSANFTETQEEKDELISQCKAFRTHLQNHPSK